MARNPQRTNYIVARPAYAGVGSLESELGGIWDTISGAVKTAVTAYGNTKQTQGAAAALAAQQQPMVVPQSGPSTTTMLLVGGGVLVGAVLLLKKRKK